MVHLYISVYFNPLNDPLRKKLTQEFMNRYPWIILLQGTYNGVLDIECDQTVRYDLKEEKGMIIFLIVNHFLDRIGSIDSLTLIDSDLILQDNFRELQQAAIKDVDVLHGFDKSFEKLESGVNGVHPFCVHSYLVNGKCGHTGYLWSFNDTFLQKINYKFMDFFVLGGQDYILMKIITNGTLECIRKTDIYSKVLVWKKKLGPVKYDYLRHTVLHNYHGSKLNRLTDFQMYKNLTQNFVELNLRNRSNYLHSNSSTRA